jgi:hypothetical protein
MDPRAREASKGRQGLGKALLPNRGREGGRFPFPQGFVYMKFFEQQELLQICLGRREVILNFASALTLTVQSRFACFGVSQPNFTELPLSASSLLPFIGAHVVTALFVTTEQATSRQ